MINVSGYSESSSSLSCEFQRNGIERSYSGSSLSSVEILPYDVEQQQIDNVIEMLSKVNRSRIDDVIENVVNGADSCPEVEFVDISLLK